MSGLLNGAKLWDFETQSWFRWCDTCDKAKHTAEVDELIDPIWGRSHGWQCRACSEEAFEAQASGD